MNNYTLVSVVVMSSLLNACGHKVSRNPPIDKTSAVAASQKKSIANFPVHGRFCGRNYPPVIYNDRVKHISYLLDILPQDDIDHTCKKHDICYAQENSNKKNCDILLRDSMPPSRLIRKEYRYTNTIGAKVYESNYCNSIISGINSFTAFSLGGYTSGIGSAIITAVKGSTQLVENVGESAIGLTATLFNGVMAAPVMILALPGVIINGSDSNVVKYAKGMVEGVFLIDDAIDNGLPKLKSNCNIWSDSEADAYEKEREKLYDRIRKTRKPNKTKVIEIGSGLGRKTKSLFDKL